MSIHYFQNIGNALYIDGKINKTFFTFYLTSYIQGVILPLKQTTTTTNPDKTMTRQEFLELEKIRIEEEGLKFTNPQKRVQKRIHDGWNLVMTKNSQYWEKEGQIEETGTVWKAFCKYASLVKGAEFLGEKLDFHIY